ncbi:MAG: hypothetical protein HY291_18810 [Planctomycetes bacterium]|nr:hypothetical protein [Planctomycetota bacterium]
MLTRDAARLQVLLDLQRRHGHRQGPEELVILDEHTIERPWGWVFFYTTRGWRDGEDIYAIGGNAPYMINLQDGSIRLAGTALTIDEYIEAYEVELERQSGTWNLFINEQADCPQSVVSGIRSSLGLSLAELSAFKQRLPCVWSSGAFVDLEPVCQRLQAAGVRAEVRRAPNSKPGG